ncbi:hypothetical protein ACGILS_23390 [Streptomyces albidoflavus]|uniref:hypothetical protein n=1 Tax=Streptomyces albidoflavus TaxID=1886 RepID=UPI001C44D4DA|nr:hypothetical protein [Streptomyces albidoflavus]MBV7650815.1 hypothetical protein [Streptomyces albidoflavus]MBV7712280.1 hypothetical protein [Streptomyces albidoflavus]MCU7703401.1 hypothetical protein [Streptomyces albidoflavus]
MSTTRTRRQRTTLSAYLVAALAMMASLFIAPAAHAEDREGTIDATAITREWDKAVKYNGTPSMSGLLCKGTSGLSGMGCYKSNGDIWYLFDGKADGMSVAVEWFDYNDSTSGDSSKLYRYGVCINSSGAPSWASCNKNYYEHHTLAFRMCYYDDGKRVESTCSFWGENMKP